MKRKRLTVTIDKELDRCNFCAFFRIIEATHSSLSNKYHCSLSDREIACSRHGFFITIPDFCELPDINEE